MKVFLATPKAMDEDEALRLRDEIEQFVNRVYPDAKIVLASDEFRRYSGSFDGWAGWSSHVATGVEYNTRKLHYPVVVLPGKTMGKATATIVQLRIASKHPVVMWNGTGFEKVGAVNEIDGNDFIKGWEAVVEGHLH